MGIKLQLGVGTLEARFSTAKPYAHFTKLCLVVLSKFLGDFGDVWDVFLKGLVKFGEIRNIQDLM